MEIRRIKQKIRTKLIPTELLGNSFVDVLNRVVPSLRDNNYHYLTFGCSDEALFHLLGVLPFLVDLDPLHLGLQHPEQHRYQEAAGVFLFLRAPL